MASSKPISIDGHIFEAFDAWIDAHIGLFTQSPPEVVLKRKRVKRERENCYETQWGQI